MSPVGGERDIEVPIDAPAIVAVDRFRARRRELLGRGELHPQAEVPDAAVDAAVDDARSKLEAVGAALKEVIYIRADQRLEDTYADLLAAIGDADPAVWDGPPRFADDHTRRAHNRPTSVSRTRLAASKLATSS